MLGRFSNYRRGLAEWRRACAASRKCRLIVRTAIGGLIGAVLSHEAVEIIAAHSHPWVHWSTVVGAGLGGAVAALGRERAAVTVPLVVPLVTVLGCIAVFHRHDVSAVGDNVTFVTALDRRLGLRSRDLDLSTYVEVPAPTLHGCGPVNIEMLYSARPKHPRGFNRQNPPRATVTVRHPSRMDVEPDPRSGGVQEPTAQQVQVSEKPDKLGVVDTTFSWALTDLDDLRERPFAFQLRLDLDGLAVPRGLGSCEVTVPFIRGMAARAPDSLAVIRPAHASNEVYAQGSHLLSEDFNPRPDDKSASTVEWNCPEPGKGSLEGHRDDCAAIMGVEADWHDTVEQLALLVLGALIALVIERVVRHERRTRESERKG